MRDPQKIDNLDLFVDLLGSEDFRKLFALVSESPIGRDSLIGIRLPMGMSVIEAETIIEKITQLFASWYPIVNEDGISYWLYPTKEIIRLLREIDRKSSGGSPMEFARNSEHGTRLDLAALRTATEFICSLSGFEVESDRAEKIILMDENPKNDIELAFVNTFNTLNDIPALAQSPQTLDTSFIDNIFARITDSIESASEEAIYKNSPKEEQSLRNILEVSNSCWSDMSPLLDVILIRWSLQYLRPYGKYSLIVADVYARQLMVRIGYSSLRFIPFFTTHIPGSRGLRITSQQESHIPIGNGNLTPILTEDLREINRAIDEQLNSYEEVFKKDRRAYRVLKNDYLSLNHRQRSILERALRIPNATFHIRYHQSTHGIAYSTAREDLFKLVNTGYLVCNKIGKTYVFTAAPNLCDLINKRTGADLLKE